MNNQYEIRGETTVIFVDLKGERKEILIDTEDLPKADSFPNLWRIKYDKTIDGYYATGKINIPKKKWHQFHRWLLDCPNDKQVDHINHNPLDNRKSNLRICTQAENAQNKRIFKNSSTGVRGVGWHKMSGKWAARIQVNGKRVHLGLFETIEEAQRIAVEARKKHMPYAV